eukprot:TRINITY_DN2246_c0_g1_i1.p1 TRINITY_DN2246_c0_g1~~TRINITY_DN2246_c0_g1_i1.p1  ORF type:complete len:646 (+),score=164.33 TRINITY_DN2246_c0_g1_i1:1-1938(+)
MDKKRSEVEPLLAPASRSGESPVTLRKTPKPEETAAAPADAAAPAAPWITEDEEDPEEAVNLKKRFRRKLRALFPIVIWAPTYNWRQDLLWDFVAGLTIAVMAIPQSMAYADLAGMPEEYGLYTVFTPNFWYAPVASSKHLVNGIGAINSLITGQVVEGLIGEYDSENSNEYIELALMVGFVSGVYQMVMSVLNLGFVVNFLGHPLVYGFTTGVAVLITCSQIENLTGIEINSDLPIFMIGEMFSKITQFHWQTFTLGVMCICLIYLCRYLGRNYARLTVIMAAGPLFVVAIATLITYAADLESEGVVITGSIPSGLPKFKMLKFNKFSDVAAGALLMSLLGYMESASISTSVAVKMRYDVRPNQELYALGWINLMCPFFGAWSCSGSFTRTAIGLVAGARTPVAQIFSGLMVGITLLLLTPLFKFLPKCCLGAIILTSVPNLVAYDDGKRLWKINKEEFAIFFLTFLLTAILGVQNGLLLSFATSVVVLLVRMARPQIVMLALDPQTATFQPLESSSLLKPLPGIEVVAVRMPIMYANVNFIKEQLQRLSRLRKYETRRSMAGPIRVRVFDLSAVTYSDTTAAATLGPVLAQEREQGVLSFLAGLPPKTAALFDATGLLDIVGREHVFPDLHAAVAAAKTHVGA